MAEPCTFLRAGKLSAIVGDDTERGPGGKQYSGLWSLNHASHGTGLFQAAYAGLIATRIAAPVHALSPSTARPHGW